MGRGSYVSPSNPRRIPRDLHRITEPFDRSIAAVDYLDDPWASYAGGGVEARVGGAVVGEGDCFDVWDGQSAVGGKEQRKREGEEGG